MREGGYHKLLIWQKSKELVKTIYLVSNRFPDVEKHGLTSQLRRAAVSVVLNIVEGHRRETNKEFVRFLNISDASLVEVEACLELCLDLGYLSQIDFDKCENKRREVAAMLTSFTKSIKLR